MLAVIKYIGWRVFVLFLCRFATVEDILLILVFLYSLTGGQDCYDSPMEEEQVKVSLYVLSILKWSILSVKLR